MADPTAFRVIVVVGITGDSGGQVKLILNID